jgi:hypothetical protein
VSKRGLPPPTELEREEARAAAAQLRAALADRSKLGEKTVAHVDLTNPRRGEWWTTYSGLPGFTKVNGAYRHALLPGWQYTWPEVKAEMLPDLMALAERGVRPTEATA